MDNTKKEVKEREADKTADLIQNRVELSRVVMDTPAILKMIKHS